MQRKYVSSYRNIMGYIGKFYGSSILKSIERDEIVVMDMPEPADYAEDQFKALTFAKKELWKAQVNSFNNWSGAISTKVQDAYHLI